jgi:hypothetical protein
LLVELKPPVGISSVECVQESKEFRGMVLSERLGKMKGGLKCWGETSMGFRKLEYWEGEK